MKKNKFIAICFFIALFTCAGISSCKKDSTTETPVTGNITLKVHCLHHTWDVTNINVYLKYNTLSFPGADSTLYDRQRTTDGSGQAAFDNLYPGNYYVYASGFDTTFGAQVIGYKQVTISKENVTNNEMAVTLYVSE